MKTAVLTSETSAGTKFITKTVFIAAGGRRLPAAQTQG